MAFLFLRSSFILDSLINFFLALIYTQENTHHLHTTQKAYSKNIIVTQTDSSLHLLPPINSGPEEVEDSTKHNLTQLKHTLYSVCLYLYSQWLQSVASVYQAHLAASTAYPMHTNKRHDNTNIGMNGNLSMSTRM